MQKERGIMKMYMLKDPNGYFLRGVDAIAPPLASALSMLASIPSGAAPPYDQVDKLFAELETLTQVHV